MAAILSRPQFAKSVYLGWVDSKSALVKAKAVLDKQLILLSHMCTIGPEWVQF